MKHIYIDEHHVLCDYKKHSHRCSDRWTWDFIFIANGEFFIIEHHPCWFGINEYEKKAKFISLVLEKKSKKKKYWDTKPSWHLSEEFKKERVSFLQKKKDVEEVHYIYSDNAGKLYCIVTQTDFFSKLDYKDRLKEDLRLVVDWIKQNRPRDIKNLVEYVEELACINIIDVDDLTITKTINETLSEIRKQLKNK